MHGGTKAPVSDPLLMKVFKDVILFIVRTPKSQEVEILRNKSDLTVLKKKALNNLIFQFQKKSDYFSLEKL